MRLDVKQHEEFYFSWNVYLIERQNSLRRTSSVGNKLFFTVQYILGFKVFCLLKVQKNFTYLYNN